MPRGDSSQAGTDHGRSPWKETRDRMPMLAEVVDAVGGGETHRDTHALEMTTPTGVTIATMSISNDERGFADALAWIVEHAAGPRVMGEERPVLLRLMRDIAGSLDGGHAGAQATRLVTIGDRQW
jgi:hypothetical protein